MNVGGELSLLVRSESTGGPDGHACSPDATRGQAILDRHDVQQERGTV